MSIDVNNRLPRLGNDVVVWFLCGSEWEWGKGALHDINGNDGYIKWVTGLGTIVKQKNIEFPENLYWTISGFPGVSFDFNEVKYWDELPGKPV